MGACGGGDSPAREPAPITAEANAALEDTLRRLISDAYRFDSGGGVSRLMSVYARGDAVASASGGRIIVGHDALQREMAGFWERVGRNMREPRFEISHSHLERLGPDGAALTFAYRIPHVTPDGRPHEAGGAWTAVFARREGRWMIVQEHLSDLPTR